jgi:hypothetical protein
MSTPDDGFRKKVSTSGDGCSCDFYNVGLKLYRMEGERDRAFDRQKLAHEHGIGPMVVAKLEVDGYPALLTQLAENIGQYPGEDAVMEFQNKHKEVFGYRVGDWHNGNYGYVDDALVFIDFGDHGYQS